MKVHLAAVVHFLAHLNGIFSFDWTRLALGRDEFLRTAFVDKTCSLIAEDAGIAVRGVCLQVLRVNSDVFGVKENVLLWDKQGV